MYQFLTLFLPLYFIIYFGAAFILKAIFISRLIGKNPIVLSRKDDAYGVISFYFKLTILFIFVYVLFFAFLPELYNKFLLIPKIEILFIKYIGIGFLIFSLIWTIISQNHMKISWRIGIDTTTKTKLITTGLFKFSRNPIFFGILISLTGLFLVTPNIATLFFLFFGFMLIQIQIRLEEEFLLKQHGELYVQYQKKVRRYI